MKLILKKKQAEMHDRFCSVRDSIESYVSLQECDNLLDKTMEEMKNVLGDSRAGFAWSGGKDSMPIQWMMEELGHPECVLGMTDDLEYPAFLKFVTDNMPGGLNVHNSGHTMKWLSSNLDMLFPSDSRTAARWFKLVQHNAQETFFKEKRLDILATGRRRQDGNYVGPDRYTNLYQSDGVVRYSPMSEWKHEHVLAVIHYKGLKYAPCYSWPNGFIVGTGNWAARQWTGSIENGWRELWDIDPTIVERAAKYIKSANSFLFKNNL